MSAAEKAEVLTKVASSPLSKRKVLRELDIPKSTYYRWLGRKDHHQMWATDASYFRVVGWGFYYLVTVMDDYSRFILSHKLQRDMTSYSFIDVVQEAVDRTGMDQVPVTDQREAGALPPDAEAVRKPGAL